MKPRVGEVYQGRYRILAELGAGGMGSVFRAEQIDADRQVALKILQSERLEDRETVARFYREFKLLSQLSHPNIMTLYGLALDDDSTPFAICEFLSGVSLRSLIAEGPLAWQRALKICIQVCQAMQYAHEQGILHRDLKPENVLVMQVPEPDFVKLIDFGLAATLETITEGQRLTSTGFIVGSPPYMAPEQISGKSERQSDIYALGCLLFELLTGKQLFDGDCHAAVVYRQLNESPSARFKLISSSVPPAMLLILNKMLAKKIEDRYESMARVSAELEAVLEEPASRAQTGMAERLSGIRRLVVIALSALAAMGLLALALSSRKQPEVGLHVDHKKVALPSQQMDPGRSASLISRGVSTPGLIAQSRSLVRAGNRAAAIELLSKAIKSSVHADPYDLYDAHAELAYLFQQTGNFHEAAREWLIAIDIFKMKGSPKRLHAGCGLAEALDLSGEIEKADETYQRFILEAEHTRNGAANPLMDSCSRYVVFLDNHKRLEQAYKWAKHSLSYSDRALHGLDAGIVRTLTKDRATQEAVIASWIFYDICKEKGAFAEGRRELDKTRSQLRASSLRDDFTSRAIISYARAARERGFDDEAQEMYELALKECSGLSSRDAKDVQETCSKALADLKMKHAHLE